MSGFDVAAENPRVVSPFYDLETRSVESDHFTRKGAIWFKRNPQAHIEGSRDLHQCSQAPRRIVNVLVSGNSSLSRPNATPKLRLGHAALFPNHLDLSGHLCIQKRCGVLLGILPIPKILSQCVLDITKHAAFASCCLLGGLPDSRRQPLARELASLGFPSHRQAM